MKGITIHQKKIALAWALGEITIQRASVLLKRSQLGVYILLARALREIVKENENC